MSTGFEQCPNYRVCEEVSKDHQVHRETLEWHRRVGYYMIACIVSVASLVGINTLQVNDLKNSITSYITYQKEKDEKFGYDSSHTMEKALDSLILQQKALNENAQLRKELEAHIKYTEVRK